MTTIAPRYNTPFTTAFDTFGVVAPGAFLRSYLTGSSTPTPTYSNATLTISNGSFVQANAAGLFGDIFLDPAIIYKFVLETSDGDEIWTADPVASNSPSLTIVTTLADLRLISGPNPSLVFLEGTTTPGDGIQGNFYWSAVSTAADDGGQTVVAPTGVVTGRWLRLPLGWPNGGMNTNGAAILTGFQTVAVNGVTPTESWSQLSLFNSSAGTHAGMSIVNTKPTTEEATISFNSYGANATVHQQGSWFARWYQGNNSVTTGINLMGMHVDDYVQDNTLYVGYSDNSALYQAGATSSIPWDNAKPPTGWGRFLGSGTVFDNPVVIGTGHTFSVQSGYVLETNGPAAFGRVNGSGIQAESVEVGYSAGGSTAFIQGLVSNSATPIPLLVGGSTLKFAVEAGLTTAVTISAANSTGIRFNGYGAGTLTSDASGNITAVSDLRLKTNIKKYHAGLFNVLAVSPISYQWAKESGMETEGRYAGFGAQHLDAARVDHAAKINGDGFYSLDDRAVIATLWNAVKTLGYMLAATWLVVAAAIVYRLI